MPTLEIFNTLFYFNYLLMHHFTIQLFIGSFVAERESISPSAQQNAN